MPSFKSMSTSDPDIYWLSFQEKKGRFYYHPHRAPNIVSRAWATLTGFFPRWFYPALVAWSFIVLFVFGRLIGLWSFSFLLVSVAMLLSSLRQIDPLAKKKGLMPQLTLDASNLANPTILRLWAWGGLRFWYSGDVGEKIKEAVILRVERKGPGPDDWLLSIFFSSKPTSGQLGLAFK